MAAEDLDRAAEYVASVYKEKIEVIELGARYPQDEEDEFYSAGADSDDVGSQANYPGDDTADADLASPRVTVEPERFDETQADSALSLPADGDLASPQVPV